MTRNPMNSSLHRARAISTRATLAASIFAVACSTTANPRRQHPDVSPPVAYLDSTAYDAGMRVELAEVRPAEASGLHNVYRLSENIVSGSEPDSETGFEALHEMGIRTILSVDGKVPDQALAGKYGMTYVHVPIQYRGITGDETLQIAKTFREQPGPFYVHCFHGKHRGPAAAAVGRLVLDGAPREQALAEMRQWCGTSGSYEGLYRVIADGRIPSADTTRAYAWDFPAARPFAGLRSAMVEVSRADDNLKYLSKRAWRPDAEHPDADALNEAVKLATALERTAALDEVAEEPADFRGFMDQAVSESVALRDAISSWRAGEQPVGAVSAAYERLSASCTACHNTHRN